MCVNYSGKWRSRRAVEPDVVTGEMYDYTMQLICSQMLIVLIVHVSSALSFLEYWANEWKWSRRRVSLGGEFRPLKRRVRESSSSCV